MKKVMKIVGIILLAIVIVTSLTLIKYKKTAKKVTKLKEKADIYIYYCDYTSEMTPMDEKYDLININEKKLYEINWKDKSYEIHGHISKIINRRYTIKTRNISDEEIAELLNAIDEEKEYAKYLYTTKDYPKEESLHNHFNVFYNNFLVELKELPFSY